MIRKDVMLTSIKGYKRAHALIVEEKIKRLTRLSGKDSLREYIALCGLAVKVIRDGDQEALAKKKVEFLLKRRRIFNRIARLRKNQ